MQPLTEGSGSCHARPVRAYRPHIARRHLKFKPSGYQLSQETDQTFQRLWHYIAYTAIAAALVYGAHIGGQLDRMTTIALNGLDNVIARSGFSITKIDISGLRRIDEAEISRILLSDKTQSIWKYDTSAAQARLETLPWVKQARVLRLLPGTIKVDVIERTPFAYWQYKGAHYLIGLDGAIIHAAEPGAHGSLARIVGEGAPQHAGKLLSALMRYPDIATRVKTLVRVADRRWNILLKSGTQILLPEGQIGPAFRRLTTVNERRNLLSASVAVIDLRLPERVTVTPRSDSAASTSSTISPSSAPNLPDGDV